jgi:hypothetical protein
MFSSVRHLIEATTENAFLSVIFQELFGGKECALYLGKYGT